MVNNKIALLMCGTCQCMSRELTYKVLQKHKDSLQIVSVNCPAEMDPFVAIKMLKTNWSGIIVPCLCNTCCCPKNQKAIKRREMIRNILPVFDIVKERYRVLNISTIDFSTLDSFIEEMIEQIKLLDETKHFGQLAVGISRETNIPLQLIN